METPRKMWCLEVMQGVDFFDITPEVSPGIAVFPGDQPYVRKVTMDTRQGQHLTLSTVTSTLHLGAHADAANHYHRDGAGVEQRPLEPYLGTCQVVELKAPSGARLTRAHWGSRTVQAKRVLFKTGSFPDPNRWNDDFNSLSGELIRFLADQGVLLVGIDTPSIDPAADQALESHQAIYRHGLCVLEGLVLTAVPEGLYQLVALPLRLKDADASPVRAVLLKDWPKPQPLPKMKVGHDRT